MKDTAHFWNFNVKYLTHKSKIHPEESISCYGVHLKLVSTLQVRYIYTRYVCQTAADWRPIDIITRKVIGLRLDPPRPGSTWTLVALLFVVPVVSITQQWIWIWMELDWIGLDERLGSRASVSTSCDCALCLRLWLVNPMWSSDTTTAEWPSDTLSRWSWSPTSRKLVRNYWGLGSVNGIMA